jgi:hypothetical protein
MPPMSYSHTSGWTDRGDLSLCHQEDLVLCVAWALPTGQDLDATTLVGALGTWFGQPA